MPEDRSLDEFAVPSADGEADADGEATADEETGDNAGDEETDDAVAETTTDDGADDAAVETTTGVDAVDVDPAVPTATWTTDGAPCDRCGERVARRWLDDDDLVCGACKEW
jgi:formylmethanofuran dehydrogenase subunit E